jgi:hypothetical protein
LTLHKFLHFFQLMTYHSSEPTAKLAKQLEDTVNATLEMLFNEADNIADRLAIVREILVREAADRLLAEQLMDADDDIATAILSSASEAADRKAAGRADDATATAKLAKQLEDTVNATLEIMPLWRCCLTKQITLLTV